MSEDCYPWICDTKRNHIEFDFNKFRSEPKKNSDWTYAFMFTVLAISVMIAAVSEFSMFRFTTNASMVFSGCMGMIVYVACWLWLMNKQDGYT